MYKKFDRIFQYKYVAISRRILEVWTITGDRLRTAALQFSAERSNAALQRYSATAAAYRYIVQYIAATLGYRYKAARPVNAQYG